MNECNINLIKTHPDAKLPTCGHTGDNCWDLYAVEDVVIPGSINTHTGVYIGNAVVPVGLKVASISPGFGIVIKGRSGLGFKHGIVPHFGEIDNGYRGDLGVKLYNLTGRNFEVKKGDRIAQLKVEKNYWTTYNFVDAPEESARGESGFGSTGN